MRNSMPNWWLRSYVGLKWPLIFVVCDFCKGSVVGAEVHNFPERVLNSIFFPFFSSDEAAASLCAAAARGGGGQLHHGQYLRVENQAPRT